MVRRTTRRAFLGTAASGGVLLGLGEGLKGLPRVTAEEATLPAKLVQLRPEIEPIVRLLEDTPREKVLETFAARIRAGLSYREVLAALLLAGVRNVQPRPVGFKFHAVLVVNSAHLASLSSPDADRWLPIFWALDYFKDSQAQDVKQGNWTMAPVDEAAVPRASQAKGAFVAAMDNWDEAAADAAVAGLARSAGINEVFELFVRYGARDFRAIGHKAIFVANSRRTLECIGYEHAEPVLRSLAYALLVHEGDNPAKRDGEPDRPGRKNLELIEKIRPEWQEGKPDTAAATELLAALREGSEQAGPEKVVELLNRGIAPQSIWDALFNAGGELLMRQPGIVGLHTLTTTNALHYAYQASGDDRTRRWLLLQNAAFLPMFRAAMHDRGKVGDARIDTLAPIELTSSGPDAIREIFADVSRDRATAARKLLSYLKTPSDAKSLLDAARVLVFHKGRDSHDYKFSAAVFEDYYASSPEWRDRLLAASLFQLPGSGSPDTGLVARTRAAFAG